ncbi:threonine-phosphate decarboxylase [Halobacillus andaensis]|uniref:threonine-phosphate decarboxylase n=1 Tax=Halobacillus andaensis TaxID=1176239 RepID=A0A917EY46_HALAA|nr:threonine-phosphate decarboxylase CobD [Halobacillus andaensis]MBP2005185.1 threonine-phosphate decarboxylase [Halobacillus andaensis]GGF29511.1 threonine-phosphate decarboxylase [Halobacillus andaensis]
MKWPAHGANPHYLTESMNLPPVQYDFSVNVNPLGPPEWLKEKWQDFYHLVMEYPDPHNKRLIETIAETEGISEEQVLVGNGASELLMLLGGYFSGKRVLIVEPTFSEYRTIAQTHGCQVETVFLKEEERWQLPVERIEEKMAGVDLVILCNPNNPTGVHYDWSEMAPLLETCEMTGTYLVIDEAFYDFVEQEPSLIQHVKSYSKLIVLRSLTKMYAVPGLRMGYAAADKHLVEELSHYQPTWSVNGLAQAVAERCVQDDVFRKGTRRYIQSEKDRLFPALQDLSFTVTDSEVNYYLLGGYPNLGETLLPFLLENRIAARHTYNFPGIDGEFIRLCIHTKEANDRLLELLARWAL